MILYHFSKGNYDILKPMYGENRNSGEGEATNKEVIFLTTANDMIIWNEKNENEYKYRYTVDINENDECLHLDYGIEKIMNDYHGEDKFKWYFYTKELKWLKKDKWNSELKVYN